MNLASDFDFKTNVSNRFGTPIKAFHDVDERRRMAMRQAFENRVGVSAIAKQFEVSEREVWSAAKNDRSLGGALNERFWRHVITIKAGNDWDVTEQRAKERLSYLALRLKRKIWGNNNKKQRKIAFFVFRHSWGKKHNKIEEQDESVVHKGSTERVGVHWHALMAVRGNHGWSDEQITDAINEIERNSKIRRGAEMVADVEFGWKNGNAMHDYVGREFKQTTMQWEYERKAKFEARSVSELRAVERHFAKKKIDKNINDGLFIMKL